MVNPELSNYIKLQLQSGASHEQIRTGLLTGGWTNADIDEAFQSAPATMNTPNTSTTKANKKHHFLGPILFFIIVLGGYVGIEFYAKMPLTKEFILGACIISFVLTLIFTIISFVIRKIGSRFGTKYSVILWVLIVLGIVGGASYYVYSQRSYLYSTPGTILLSDHKITLDECLSTKDENLKPACAMNFAITQKDESICRKVQGETAAAYYCEMNYEEYYNVLPTDIKQCTTMSESDEYAQFYKNGCFTGVAISTKNPSYCNYIKSESSKASCLSQSKNTGTK